MQIMEFLIFLIVLILYFLPTVSAYASKHQSSSGIFIINLFTGWTLLGWIVALIWSFSKVITREEVSSTSKSIPKDITNLPTLPRKPTNKVPIISSNSTKSNEESEFDDLATFTISYGQREEHTTNKSPGRWIPESETLKVSGKLLCKGNVYYGGLLKAFDNNSSHFNNQETEASLIDDSLKVNKEEYSYTDDSLGYWPKFITLSPKCRGAYIDWLASDRNDPLTPIGYVFIYFYGIERRITVDANQGKVDDFEYKALFQELLRLIEIYRSSRSFYNYGSHLVQLMCVVRPEVVTLPSDDKLIRDKTLLFKVELAKRVLEGKEIPADIALSWIKFYPEYSLRTPARRCNKEFSRLFKLKYTKKYGDGFIVKPNKTKLNIDYYPASSTIREVKIDLGELPDPSILKGQVKKLIAIADNCTDELESFSRYLGKKDTSKYDVAAVLLLPDALINKSSAPFLEKFKAWANTSISETGGLVSVSEIWALTGIPLPDKVNKREIELIQNLSQKAGYGIAPDSRYHHAKFNIDGKLVIFNEGHGKYFEPSKAFNETRVALRLGAMVANIDSNLDENELHILYQLVDHDSKISPTEKRSLHAYLTWRLSSPSSMTRLKTSLEKLGAKEKLSLSHFLVSVALADGRIDPLEVKQLEKLYIALGLDKSQVVKDIHSVSASKSSSKRQETSKKEEIGFLLDESLLALHESETKDVQNMLGAIFSDEEITSHPDIVEPTYSPIAIAGLDTSHNNLYQRLISKDKWSKVEVVDLCQKFDLMIDGALETINDWSFDNVDAPVLDEEFDNIYIDIEIVNELKGL